MLISFEGIDGSGKTTQALRLKERLEAEGHHVFLVREPGGTAVSERIRALLLDPSLHIEPLAELLLFSAARAQLVREVIRPAIDEGTIVVCDRFFDSTTVYQGVGRGLDSDGWLAAFNRRVTDGLIPDRTYYVDIEPEEALRRRALRGAGPRGGDRMERVSPAFYRRLIDAYRMLALNEPERWCRVAGDAPAEGIHERIWADLLGTDILRRNTPT
jgi:dTMP kinase